MLGRRQEESWQRRPRESFLNSETAQDDHEEYNEVARYMWKHNMERRRKAQSFRIPRLVKHNQSFLLDYIRSILSKSSLDISKLRLEMTLF